RLPVVQSNWSRTETRGGRGQYPSRSSRRSPCRQDSTVWSAGRVSEPLGTWVQARWKSNATLRGEIRSNFPQMALFAGWLKAWMPQQQVFQLVRTFVRAARRPE